MSLSAPKVQAPAPQTAPAMAGADALRLGVTGDPLDDLLLQGRSAALLGKMRLRVGVGSGAGGSPGVGVGTGAASGTGVTTPVGSPDVARPAGSPAGSTGSASSVAIGSAATSPGRVVPSKLRDTVSF